MSLKSKIQALITAANAKTGEADETLTDAVQTLVDGYGQGGGGSVLDEVFGAPTLLYTATVTEPVHAINIPVGDGWKTDYDYLLFVLDLDFSTSDWLYTCADEFSSDVGIPYWKKSPNAKGKNAWFISSEADNKRLFSFSLLGTGSNEFGRIYTVNPVTQWVFQLYTPSANITNGTIKVYGGVLA